MRSLAVSSPARCLITSKLSSHSRPYASSYGDGEGDPKGEDPQNQGSNPSAELEHPGPPPPAEGQGTGGGPTKAGKDGHNTQQNDSSGGRSGGKSDAGSKGSSNGAQPKIHNETPPAEPSEDVKKHNEDFDNRYGAQNKSDHNEKDKVGKGFWSGKISLNPGLLRN